MSDNISESQVIQELKEKVRSIPNFPIEGINFKDMGPILADPHTFQKAVDLLESKLNPNQIDAFALVDSRGFLFIPLALKLKKPVLMVRKAGKLPPQVIQSDPYDVEYRKAAGNDNLLEVQADALSGGLQGKNVFILDDLLATGGTLKAACDLMTKAQAHVVGVGALIEICAAGGTQKLEESGYQVTTLLKY